MRTTLALVMMLILYASIGCGVKTDPIPYVDAYPNKPVKAEEPKRP